MRTPWKGLEPLPGERCIAEGRACALGRRLTPVLKEGLRPSLSNASQTPEAWELPVLTLAGPPPALQHLLGPVFFVL